MLATGRNPFRGILLTYAYIHDTFPMIYEKCDNDIEAAYTSVFGKLDFNQYSSTRLQQNGKDIINGLLSILPGSRFGRNKRSESTNIDGDDHSDLKDHPFFDGIDWEKIENKTAIPPYIPKESERMNVSRSVSNSSTGTTGTTATLLHMMRSTRSGSKWLKDMNQQEEEISFSVRYLHSTRNFQSTIQTPHAESSNAPTSKYTSISNDRQAYFEDWNYVSPSAILLEKRHSV